MKKKLVFTIPEVARLLGVTDPTVHDMIRAGQLKALRVRSAWRIPRVFLEEYFANQGYPGLLDILEERLKGGKNDN